MLSMKLENPVHPFLKYESRDDRRSCFPIPGKELSVETNFLKRDSVTRSTKEFTQFIWIK